MPNAGPQWQQSRGEAPAVTWSISIWIMQRDIIDETILRKLIKPSCYQTVEIPTRHTSIFQWCRGSNPEDVNDEIELFRRIAMCIKIRLQPTCVKVVLKKVNCKSTVTIRHSLLRLQRSLNIYNLVDLISWTRKRVPSKRTIPSPSFSAQDKRSTSVQYYNLLQYLVIYLSWKVQWWWNLWGRIQL